MIEMLVGVCVFADAAEQRAQVIFNTRLETKIARLFEVITRGRKLHQCTVHIVFTMLGQTKFFQDLCVDVVKVTSQRVVAAFVKERGSLSLNLQSYRVTSGHSF